VHIVITYSCKHPKDVRSGTLFQCRNDVSFLTVTHQPFMSPRIALVCQSGYARMHQV
jgi:hypothetical protein